MMLTAEGTPGDAQWSLRQGAAPGPRERSREGPGVPGARRTGLAERREQKLARLKQIMQRSLSESDSDGYPAEDGRNPAGAAAARADRPTRLPIAEEEPVSNHLNLMMRKHLPSASAEKKLAFSLSGSKSADSIGYNPSPTSSDPEAAEGKTPDAAAESHDGAGGQKAATSPKSALKSPSSRRKTSQNSKLRVTFDEQVHKNGGQEAEQTKETKGHHGKERSAAGASECRRPFGAFRSIMETLSGNSNHNSSAGGAQPAAGQVSPGKKSEGKGGPGAGARGKGKTSSV